MKAIMIFVILIALIILFGGYSSSFKEPIKEKEVKNPIKPFRLF